MSRDPPTEVKRQLRREVGFACPLCGSPYLTWHHFDPPWHEGQAHDPNGMIALCLQHHKEADIGTYTNDQLRALKIKPPPTNVRGGFNWKREKTVFICGGSYFRDCGGALQVRGRKLIWFSKDDDNYDLLNLDLFRANGTLAFSMRDNDWVVYPEADDIECPPAGRSLQIRSPTEAISLSIKFESLADAPNVLTGRARTFLIDDLPDKADVLICTVTGRIIFPVPLQMHADRIEIGSMTLARSMMKSCGMGVVVQ